MNIEESRIYIHNINNKSFYYYDLKGNKVIYETY